MSKTCDFAILFDSSRNQCVPASPFCKHAGIEVTGTIVFNEANVSREGVLILDLKKTSPAGREAIVPDASRTTPETAM